MSVPDGVAPEEYNRAVCMSKTESPSVMHAVNRAWILCSKHKTQSAIYHCKVCGKFHNSHILDGTTTVACIYVGRLQ